MYKKKLKIIKIIFFHSINIFKKANIKITKKSLFGNENTKHCTKRIKNQQKYIFIIIYLKLKMN